MLDGGERRLSWVCGCLAQIALIFGYQSTAVAATTDGSWLQWSPPPECPPSAYIRKQIETWHEGALPTDLDLQTKLVWSGSRWEISVRVAFDGHAGTRQVAVAECSDAADFVAVAVVLALDPSLAGSLPLEDATSAPQAPNVASQPPLAERPERRPSSPVPAPRRVSGREARRPSFYGEAGAELLAGPLPQAQLGVSLGAGARLGSFMLGFDGHFLPATSASPGSAAAPIAFRMLSARASASYFWTLGSRIRLGPALSVEGGAISSEQRATVARQVTAPWLAVASGASTLLALTPGVHFLAELDLVAPFTRPRFVLDDGSAIHQVGFGGRLSLGMRIFFPEL